MSNIKSRNRTSSFSCSRHVLAKVDGVSGEGLVQLTTIEALLLRGNIIQWIGFDLGLVLLS